MIIYDKEDYYGFDNNVSNRDYVYYIYEKD